MGCGRVLDDTYASRDAGKILEQYIEDRSWVGSTIVDDNDLLIAFSTTGSLISSALLRRLIHVDLPKKKITGRRKKRLTKSTSLGIARP
jgi:hypothetical protein